MPIPATLITAGLLGLVFLALTIRVVGRRVSGKIMIGDGGDSQMLERIRAHANFTEHVPLTLILMAGIEITAGHHAPWLWLSGGLLVLARIAHAIEHNLIAVAHQPLGQGAANAAGRACNHRNRFG